MDDMFFQCNKNAIYVLNTSYAYGEFGRLNLFGSPNSGVLASEEFYRSRSISGSSPLSDANPAKGSTTIQKLFHSSYDGKPPPPHNNQQYHHSQQHNHFQNPQTLAKCKTTTSAVMTAAKKGPALKSAIIAKKTKFWKYLEEEKWKKHSIENLSSTNCERDREEKLAKNNSSVSGSHTNNNNNNNNNNSINSSRGGPGARNRSSDNHAKSSTELYREAAQLLGLSCTLCDNCRCLDCQSRYFECDDSDSFSEISFMGDYFDFPQLQQQKIEQNYTSCSPCRLQGAICSESDELIDNCESFSDLSIDSPNACDDVSSTR